MDVWSTTPTSSRSASPDEHPDAALYDLLMNEYPQWVKQVRALGMIG